MADETGRVAKQRAAYAEYVRLQWQLIRSPRYDPAREALVNEVAAANRGWRALGGVPDTRVGSAGRGAVQMDSRFW